MPGGQVAPVNSEVVTAVMRIGLFLLTNLAVILVASVVLNILGVGSYLEASGSGLNLTNLLIFCAVFGMAGSVNSGGSAIRSMTGFARVEAQEFEDRRMQVGQRHGFVDHAHQQPGRNESNRAVGDERLPEQGNVLLFLHSREQARASSEAAQQRLEGRRALGLRGCAAEHTTSNHQQPLATTSNY